MEDFVLDWSRLGRTGVTEAVLCDGKSAEQIGAILSSVSPDRRILLTRLAPEQFSQLPDVAKAALDYHPASRTAVYGKAAHAPLAAGIGIVAAGTSDLSVAHEAARTLAFHGHSAPVIADVGVAGLWRLMARLDEIRSFRVVIAVAGMEGALFSVLGGLVEAVVIAVPTSVGYGVAQGGRAALSSALGSCAPGLVTVNIDNGYGAAIAAIKITRTAGAGTSESVDRVEEAR